MTPKRKEPDLSTYSGRVAARLRNLRERKRLSVEETVQKINQAGLPISVWTYYTWESGTRQFPFEAIPVLAQVFGLKTCRGLFPEK